MAALRCETTEVDHSAVQRHSTRHEPNEESCHAKVPVVDHRAGARASCATRCARGGQGLAFLDEQSGKVYPLIAAAHGANQNDKVLPLVGKRVAVKGVVFVKGQDAVLQVQSIAESKAQVKGR